MNNSAHGFAAGQCWRFNAPEGFERARIMIGAIATFAGGQRILCCAVSDAAERRPDGTLASVAIPFLPMTENALAGTVTTRDQSSPAQLPQGFAEALAAWRDDPRGLTCFTVPFDGYLDRLIAHQMAAIVGTDAA